LRGRSLARGPPSPGRSRTSARPGVRLALAEVIVVAAVVLLDLPARVDRQGARHHVVEEGPVVADQQHGPLVVHQQAFQELQRLDVEVVGRLVEDQHVRRPGEELGQQSRLRSPPERTFTRLRDRSAGKRKSWR
jgi:hypothetical protein